MVGCLSLHRQIALEGVCVCVCPIPFCSWQPLPLPHACLLDSPGLFSMPELPPQTFSRFAIAGAAAHVVTETVFLPVYASKTLSQCDPVRYPEGLGGLQRVLDDARGDLASLFRAWDTTIVSNVMYGSLAFGMDEFFQRLLGDTLPPTIAQANVVPVLVVASLLASVIAAVAYSPFEALRIKIITAGALYGEEDPGVIAAFGEALQSRAAMDSLLQATWPLVLEEGPYTAGTFIVYDVVTKWLLAVLPPSDAGDFFMVSVIAGAVAGAVSAVLSHPIDTVVVRMLEGGPAADPARGFETLEALETLEAPPTVPAQRAVAVGAEEATTAVAAPITKELAAPAPPAALLGSFGATFATIVDNEGYGALFAGASTSAAFHGLMASLQFCLYEQFKSALHVSPADLLMFDAVKCDGFWC
jgi:hypothetical protein